MRNLKVPSIIIALFLIISGCEDSLQSPIHDGETTLDRSTRSAEKSFDTRYSEAGAEDLDRAFDISSRFTYNALKQYLESDQPQEEAFRTLDQNARELIADCQGESFSAPLTRKVSETILTSVLLVNSRTEGLSTTAHYQAVRHYLQNLVDNHSTKFKTQVDALKIVSQRDSDEARRLARKALANFYAYTEHLGEPVEIPQELSRRASEEQIQRSVNKVQKRQQGRLAYYGENNIAKQLAVMAGVS